MCEIVNLCIFLSFKMMLQGVFHQSLVWISLSRLCLVLRLRHDAKREGYKGCRRFQWKGPKRWSFLSRAVKCSTRGGCSTSASNNSRYSACCPWANQWHPCYVDTGEIPKATFTCATRKELQADTANRYTRTSTGTSSSQWPKSHTWTCTHGATGKGSKGNRIRTRTSVSPE